jgi:ribonuclease P protein component
VGQTLKRREILRGKYVYRDIFKNGLSIGGNAIKATIAAFSSNRNNRGPTKYFVGITLHHSVKRAVDRNRIKRWIKEAYRIHKNLLGEGTTKQETPLGIIFTCYKHPNFPHNLSFPVIENDMIKILHHLTTLHT